METLMNNADLRQHVIAALEFDPSVNASNIGVAVDDGIITLTGHVASYSEKLNAERTVQSVKGVRGIAEEIEIRYPSSKKTADDEIAHRALNVIAWDAAIPDGAVKVKVQRGWVTLTGKLEWNFQRRRAEDAVHQLSGVIGVTDLIEISPSVQVSDVKSRIETAFRRSAEVEAAGIRVAVDENRVVLEGRVNTWHERAAAERAAWAVPGVVSVVDKLAVA
jgi:osmotically-inducible protein OsmY